MNVIDIAKTLISFDTSGPPAKERPLAEWIYHYLKQLGFSVELQVVAPERANVIAKIGEGTRAGLLLSGHIDVVLAGDPELWKLSQPFGPVLADKRLYGRGACDMKGPCACMLQAVSELVEKEFKKQLTLVFTAGEDTDGWFVSDVIRDKKVTTEDARFGIVGEPTLLDVVRCHKGTGKITVALKGKAVHSSRPEIGINAIWNGVAFLNEIARIQEHLCRTTHSLLGHSTIKPTMITGGYKWNIIPDLCEIVLNTRMIPEHRSESAIREWVERAISVCSNSDPEFHAEIRKVHVSDALDVSPESEIVQILEEILSKKATGVPYATEAVDYCNAGIPTVLCGPGSIDQAHGPDEFISLNQLESGVGLYKKIISQTCLA